MHNRNKTPVLISLESISTYNNVFDKNNIFHNDGYLKKIKTD